MLNKRCTLLGCNIDLLSFNEAVEFALEKIERKLPLHIITINPEIIETAGKNKQLLDIINSSELVIPESTGIICALKLKGIRQEKIPGIDFSKELIKQCAALNYSIAMFGAKENVIKKASENLQKEFPKLNIAYQNNGYCSNETAVINAVKESGAKLVLCALGAPKQEFFINKCLKSHNAVYIGIGGSFDVWSGEVKRAPEIYQKSGLEWLYSTIKQPARIKRIYKTLPLFMLKAAAESMQGAASAE